MKKRLIILIPLNVSFFAAETYLLLHVGKKVYWYEEKPFEPAPVRDFITYRSHKAISIGLVVFVIISIIIMTLLYKGTINNDEDRYVANIEKREGIWIGTDQYRYAFC